VNRFGNLPAHCGDGDAQAASAKNPGTFEVFVHLMNGRAGIGIGRLLSALLW
jgi:hypothetical protein